MATERFITIWRKKEAPMDWDFYISESRRETEGVFRNVTHQGHSLIATYQLGAKVNDLSGPREEWKA